MELVIGTSNKGKIREIAAVLMPMGYTMTPTSAPVDEIGETIKDNAIIKALEYSSLNPGKYVIAEDSGLIVPALNNLPDAYSARFHDVELDDETLEVINVPKEEYTTDKTEIDKLNNARLISLVDKHLKESERGAFFEVCFAVAKDEEILYTCGAISSGFITTEPKGTNGFGYDPVFIGSDTFGKTYAELDNARKNLRSHRKRALQKLGLWISNNIPND